jgi:hypothetical protein
VDFKRPHFLTEELVRIEHAYRTLRDASAS